jgi:hypothetical protein
LTLGGQTWIQWRRVATKRQAPGRKQDGERKKKKRRKLDAVRKDESMRIRVSMAEKELLERAAAVLGLGVSAFVLSSAMERARMLVQPGGEGQ